MVADARRLAGGDLAAALRDSRAATLRLAFDSDDWSVPQRPGLNPIAWELGHLAWFAEFWILRGPHALGGDGFVRAARPARIAGPDAIFDSARLAHADRWSAPLPGRAELAATLEAQLDACLAAIPRDGAATMPRTTSIASPCSTRTCTARRSPGRARRWAVRRRRAWAQPRPVRRRAAADRRRRDRLGRAATAPGFSFDNELPGRALSLAPFEIDAAPLTQGAFLRFVEAGGYENASFWPDAAGAWRRAQSVGHPQRWRRAEGGGWETRWFDRWLPLAPAAPVIHVNAWEAEAYCRGPKRRLPSAAEWECAARDPRFLWGASVWEWTADAFAPYPGFAAGPYADYSAPWFGDHRELRGGAFATSRDCTSGLSQFLHPGAHRRLRRLPHRRPVLHLSRKPAP